MHEMVGAALVTGGVALVGLIGGGVKFAWNKVEKRFQRIEADLKKCEQREQTANLRSARKLTCIELLWTEVVRLETGDRTQNPVLIRVGRIIDELKATSPLNNPVQQFPATITGEE